MKIFSFETSVGAILFRIEEGKIKYLLLKYRNEHWDFPKGHIEKDETHEETMRREVREETCIENVEIKNGFCKKSSYWYFAKGEERAKRLKSNAGILVFKRVYYYLAETKTNSVQICEEHTDFTWLDLASAKEKITYGNSRRILEAADVFLKKMI